MGLDPKMVVLGGDMTVDPRPDTWEVRTSDFRGGWANIPFFNGGVFSPVWMTLGRTWIIEV